MENVIIYTNQAFGDTLITTHLATELKKQNKNINVTFSLPFDSYLNTSDHSSIVEIVDILKLQNNIDTIALHVKDNKFIIVHGDYIDTWDTVYTINGWYSDLGMVKSFMVPLFGNKCPDKLNINYNVGTKKELPKHLRVATTNLIDWNRKIGNLPKVISFLENVCKVSESPMELIPLGIDTVPRRTYLENLQLLNNCHLYLGPDGSIMHAAAGLGLDTISVYGVYPAKWICPKFYISHGNHYFLESDIKCSEIKEKIYPDDAWGSPNCSCGVWADTCIKENWCLNNIDFYKLLDIYIEWYNKIWKKS